MAVYAQYDKETGRVMGFLTFDDALLEIEKEPPSGRYLVRNGELVAAPEIGLAAPAGIKVDEEVVFEVVIPPFDEPCPDVVDMVINGRLFHITRDVPFMFSEAGDYNIKIIGPWPWQSNQVRFSVAEAPLKGGGTA